MKKLVSVAIASLAGHLIAGTYTWTGGGQNNSWFDNQNWNYTDSNEEMTNKSPGHTIDGDIMIGNGAAVVIENQVGDFGTFSIPPAYTVTIKEGASLTHDKNNWFRLPNVVLDNGSLTNKSCYSALEIYGTIQIRNGGSFINIANVPVIAESDVNVGDGAFSSGLTLKGTLTIEGGSVSGAITRSGDNSKIVLNSGTLNYSNTVELPATTTDEYNGGNIVIAGELKPPANYVFSNVNWTCVKYVPFEQPTVWQSGSLTSTNANEPYYGGGKINVPVDSTAKFTFPYSASSVYSSLVSAKFLYDGAAITAEDFNDKWTTEITHIDNGTFTTFYLTRDADWKIGAMSATDVSSSGATLSATLAKTDPDVSDYSVIVAYGIDEITESNVISRGETVTSVGNVYSKILTGLSDGVVYNYAFAIVTNNAVAAFKADTFFPSSFRYVYRNGAWLGEAPTTLNTSESVLILSPYNNELGDIAVANTVISNASLRSGTLVGSGTMQVYSSQITNAKLDDVNAVCGTYNGSTFMNFVSLSGNGIVYPACSYSFNSTEEWKDDVYNLLFNTQERIHLNGAKVDADTYAANFTLTVNSVSETGKTPYSLTLAYWESVLGGGSRKDWTVQPGARVRLAKNTRIGALNIPDAADVKIDLNGFKLTVSSLTVAGEKKKGEFTPANLEVLVGNGSLAVGGSGFVVTIR